MESMNLNMREIMDLATFAGFIIQGSEHFTDDELDETVICVKECPESGVSGDDGEPPLFYNYIAYFEDCPEEGVYGLGTG